MKTNYINTLITFILLTVDVKSNLNAQTYYWKTPVNMHSTCAGHAEYIIDGDFETTWHHWKEEAHWVILDLDESQTVYRIRQWHERVQDVEAAIAEIYVSENTTVWGTSLGSLPSTEGAELGWLEGDITDKQGRYIKLVTNSCYTPYWREIQVQVYGIADEVAPSAITNLSVTEIGIETVSLTWTASGDDNSTGTSFGYDLRYSTSIIDESNWDEASKASGEPKPSPSGSEETYIVTGLDDSTTYYFALKVRDEMMNESGISNVVSALTLPSDDPVFGVDYYFDENNDIIIVNVKANVIDQAIAELSVDNRGGTIYLPACDPNLYDHVISFPTGISMIGQGMDKTILHNCVFNIASDQVGITGDGTSRFSGMSVLNGFDEKNTGFTFRRAHGIRVDHCRFTGRFSTFAGVTIPEGNDHYFLVDHCKFDLFTSYGFYTHHNDTYFENIGSMDAFHLLGTDNKSTIFIEDCEFEGRFDHLMDGRTGSHYVFRHNDIKYTRTHEDAPSGPLEGHGPTHDGDPSNPTNVGTNCIEIYDCNIHELVGMEGGGSAGVLIRSGTAVIYNTTITNKGSGIALAVEDSPYWPRDAASYPVYHQPHGVWIWNMTYNNLAFPDREIYLAWQSAECIVENRDYFLREPSPELDGFDYTPFPYPHYLVGGVEYTDLIDTQEQIEIYPNPVKDFVTLNISDQTGMVYVKLSMLNGQTLFEKTLEHNIHQYNIDISAYEPGVYILKMESKELHQTNKIIKL